MSLRWAFNGYGGGSAVSAPFPVRSGVAAVHEPGHIIYMATVVSPLYVRLTGGGAGAAVVPCAPHRPPAAEWGTRCGHNM